MKQIILRVDDTKKVIADAIMQVHGLTQQEVLEAAYDRFIFEHLGELNDVALVQSAFTLIQKRHEEELKPLKGVMEFMEEKIRMEEQKQVETRKMYDSLKNSRYSSYLDAFARCLKADSVNDCFSKLFEYYYKSKILQEMFDEDDDNKIMGFMRSMATIHVMFRYDE
jgi:hypothetical protein